MRVSVLVILLTFAAAAPGMAQVSYGVKGGVNVANVSFDGEGDVPSSARVGLLAGVFATVPVGGPFGVQAEAVYTVKGASLDVAGIESAYIVDYVELPVLARMRLGRTLYVAAGPSMAFKLRARSRVSFGGSTEEVDLDDDVESFDLGVVGAVGIEFGRWTLDGRYTHGLSDSDADTTDAVSIRNRVFSVAAGIRF
jgi:hypothetical protein